MSPSAPTSPPADGVHTPRIEIQSSPFSSCVSDPTWRRVFRGEAQEAAMDPPATADKECLVGLDGYLNDHALMLSATCQRDGVNRGL